MPHTQIKGTYRQKWLNVLTYSAWKSILLKWICNKPPTVSEWHKVIFELLPMEYLIYWSRSKTGIFYHIWTPVLDYVWPRMSNIFWKVRPRPRKDGWMLEGGFAVCGFVCLFVFLISHHACELKLCCAMRMILEGLCWGGDFLEGGRGVVKCKIHVYVSVI